MYAEYKKQELLADVECRMSSSPTADSRGG